QQLYDIQVLPGLRHDTFVGGDDQQDQIYAGSASDHILDETLVTRHINQGRPSPARQLKLGETKVDGQSTTLLLRQPVGILTGQSQDQRRFAMIDVAGSSDYEISHRERTSPFGRPGKIRRDLISYP